MGLDWRKDVNAKLEAGMAGGGRWLVGVSSGGDSVALLKLLLAVGYGKRLVVGYFNHHWSAWGDEAQVFVEDLAKRNKLQIVIGNGKGKAGTNAEMNARGERREWMFRMCKEMGLDGMLLAHTRTDVVETFLMRAGKGSGVSGLAGMLEVMGVVGKRTWRPLLEVGREDLRDYLRSVKQDWLEDPDNEAGGSQRAKIRKLLPALAEAGIDEVALAASVEAMRRASRALAEVSHRFWNAHVLDRLNFAVDRVALLAEPEEVQLRVLERILRMGDAEEDKMVPRTGKRQDLLARIEAKEKGTATLGGVKFIWDVASLRAEKEKK